MFNYIHYALCLVFVLVSTSAISEDFIVEYDGSERMREFIPSFLSSLPIHVNFTGLTPEMLLNSHIPLPRFADLLIREKSYAVALFGKVNWFTAELYCASRGLTLASINSNAEAEQLRRYLFDAGVLRNNLQFWLSGSDLAEASTWYWFSSGRPVLYENWDINEPKITGRCMVLGVSGRWRAVDCLSNNLFICENRCALENFNP